MSFPFDIKEMESGSYRDASNVAPRKTRVATQLENSSSNPIPVTTTGVKWDNLKVSFPTENQDKFEYFYQGNLVLEFLVTYVNNTKKDILEITKAVYDLEV